MWFWGGWFGIFIFILGDQEMSKVKVFNHRKAVTHVRLRLTQPRPFEKLGVLKNLPLVA